MDFIPKKKLGFGLMRLPQTESFCPQHIQIISLLKEIGRHYTEMADE